MSNYPKIAQFKSVAQFRERLRELGCELPVDDEILAAPTSPLAQACQFGPHRLANRWVIHPMEGWDAHADGSPSEQTLRRWFRFGLSGAALIWGGEAAAVQPDGRANPRQTMAIPENRRGLAELLQACRRGAAEARLATADLPPTSSASGGIPSAALVNDVPAEPLVGLQLTHSGRFCRPHDRRMEPRIAYHHPLLDQKFGIDGDDDTVVWRDDDLERLIDRYVDAARLAAEVGFQFVDVKACHGYLLHEFLSARVRPGRFGGDFVGRTRLLLTIVRRIRSELPKLGVVVRLSVFDTLPYQSADGVGRPADWTEPEYLHGFGVDVRDPSRLDLAEPIELMRILEREGVWAVNVSCGSPYYNPHAQRPAIFPPSDGYGPPEDPLVGVVRQIEATRACKAALPELPLVGTGYTYLQDYLPHVAQAVVRAGWVDLVGLGRMVLSYPELPRDVLQNGRMQRKQICRTFSDCTTAPRNGIISGCFPLDPYYKERPEAEALRQCKAGPRM